MSNNIAGGNKEALAESGTLPQILPKQQPVTLAVRTVSGTGAEVDATFIMREGW